MTSSLFDKKPETKTLAEKNGKILQFVTALNADKLDIYAFIVMPKEKKIEFEKALTLPELNLEKWGQIVASGYGVKPLEINKFEIIEAFKDGDYE